MVKFKRGNPPGSDCYERSGLDHVRDDIDEGIGSTSDTEQPTRTRGFGINHSAPEPFSFVNIRPPGPFDNIRLPGHFDDVRLPGPFLNTSFSVFPDERERMNPGRIEWTVEEDEPQVLEDHDELPEQLMENPSNLSKANRMVTEGNTQLKDDISAPKEAESKQSSHRNPDTSTIASPAATHYLAPTGGTNRDKPRRSSEKRHAGLGDGDTASDLLGFEKERQRISMEIDKELRQEQKRREMSESERLRKRFESCEHSGDHVKTSESVPISDAAVVTGPGDGQYLQYPIPATKLPTRTRREGETQHPHYPWGNPEEAMSKE
jgi:hypothetical protein